MSGMKEIYMHRCLELAKAGEGRTAPNPMVGCVIVYEGRIIGEGYHTRCGMPHAEVNAINSVKDKELLKKSTLYVNLEPCSHYGKTPPCSDLIVSYSIPEVIIGTIDPFSLVAGRGIEKLKTAGCNVETSMLEKECRELNRRFFTFHEKKRPYIILKWAQTSDGFIDTNRKASKNKQPKWITNEIARVAVHKQRATEQAIFIGTETAIADNPSLTLRDWYGNQPVRIIPDLHGRLPINLSIFDGSCPTVIITSQNKKKDYPNSMVITCGDNLLTTLTEFLYKNEIQSLIVEGGAKTLTGFINEGLWDEAHIYTGEIKFQEGVKAPEFKCQSVKSERINNSILNIYRK
ncbi:MAG: bifunctional diaminohydroxyphosphoribosylaminopyrimidine deaminase/5-amino-6-(5-phosphoribosylamino)uracil reductase RibD [Prolixibacteraceae bacterium]|nr:bifunctional diaminohydroxyphosphoribosylaminopyrimidine deaminase/5-amino-6-(5-phosphoribosylamino)uracil reductase RibD [Prolixibacteraceae bacterium]